MAYAALVSLAQTIQHILQHGDHQSPVFLRERQRIRSLHDHVVFLQSFLEEFTDKLADNLEGRMGDVANEAEDIVEYFIFDHIQSFYSHRRRKQLGDVRCFSFISEQTRSFHSHLRKAGQLGNVQNPYHQYDIKKLYEELQKVTHELDSIVGEVMAIKNSLRSGDDVELISYSPSTSSLSRQVRTPMDKDSVVGFDEDLMAIKSRLCGESSKLQVIPIFGMGGIGKTTPARNAYEDPLTVEYFHFRAWVTVSQDYSVERILSELLVFVEALNEERFDQRNETVDVTVYKSLKGRRYLIVMDDIWSTNVWDGVRRLFPDDNNGSRIMLTTRLSDVAAYVDCSSPLHEMHFMDVCQSWNLLRLKLFKQEQCPHELEDIGRMIARSCRGLPLAIVVIAGILAMISRTQASWEIVAKNVTMAVFTNEEQFANILSLSYTHLPHHLRSCFLYMGGFPEDYEIHVSKLIKLWTSEGFIKPSGSQSYEESAEEYLEDLVKRSLVLVTKRKPDGRIKSCNVHDLVRDLCIRKAQEEKFLGSGFSRQRRISIHDRVRLSELEYYDSANHTILRFPLCQETLYCLKKFRLLRVLDARCVELIFKFPSEVLELIFLRYLAFSFMHRAFSGMRDIEFEIPASISVLRNLETLIICPPTKKYERFAPRVRFPSLEIWRMTQLRHLFLFTLDTLPNPCPRYSALENLQTLTKVTNFKCTEAILQMIPNLKKLGIIYEGDGIEWSEYHLDNLVHLHQLEKLDILVQGLYCNWKSVPLWGNLAFPTTLRKLKLMGCLLCSQDMLIVGSLPNLELLKLNKCYFEGCKWETNEGEFPRLKFLQVFDSNLEHWMTESGHFPCLKRLMLGYCWVLGEIPNDIGEIPTLELIELYKWADESLVESVKRIKEEQQSNGNDSLQVCVMKNYL